MCVALPLSLCLAALQPVDAIPDDIERAWLPRQCSNVSPGQLESVAYGKQIRRSW